jgi:ubiquinone/menaquinone biosynthesis C-methylase UbiE
MRSIRLDPDGLELSTLDSMVALHGARVLEIGCGDGRLTQALARRARRVIALDPDRLALARARRTFPQALKPRVQFRAGRAGSLPFPDEAFDAAIFSWSL